MISVNRSHLALSKYLLLSGANPNLQNNDGSTALALASAHGFTHHVRLLIAAQADTNKPKLVSVRWLITSNKHCIRMVVFR